MPVEMFFFLLEEATYVTRTFFFFFFFFFELVVFPVKRVLMYLCMQSATCLGNKRQRIVFFSQTTLYERRYKRRSKYMNIRPD